MPAPWTLSDADALAAVQADERALLRENAEEVGLPWDGTPAVERVEFELPSGRRISALRWGEGEPEIAFLHGGAQNAHTWDTVALALGRPLVALDLPGHGRSDWRDDGDYAGPSLALDVAPALEALAPRAALLVGMSLGGLTAICVAAAEPRLAARLAIIDVTPGTNREKAKAVVDFVSGPENFESFEAILERTVAHHPTRSRASLRRGVLHNAKPLADGRWTWRYDLVRRGSGGRVDFSAIWDAVSSLAMPVMLVRGGLSTVVSDEDEAEWLRRQPGSRIEAVSGAGHSIQGDRPLELARLLGDFTAE
jgi:pimeloyl-ACP methyl ester carboxylesterase